MRRIIYSFFLLSILSLSTLSSQDIARDSVNIKQLSLSNNNTWALGAGGLNFIMHGDLRSIGTGSLGNFYNFGGYIYADKMFNPLLGMEIKANYFKISGGAQYFSNVYDILYIDKTKITDNLYFEGAAYGLELNLIMSFSNLYKKYSQNWNISGYFGAGFQLYDSALFEKAADGSINKLIDFGTNPTRNNKSAASSIYLSAQLGLKRKISNRVDVELRSGIYFNNEDHLDATISNKQDWETFFLTGIGLVVKLGRENVFSIWGEESVKAEPFKVQDGDKDGVIDELDLEPDTPLGVMVYGNGKAIDTDADGLADYKDDCPFVKGPISNQGCPIKVEEVKVVSPVIHQQINVLAASIYFETDSDHLKEVSYATLDEIISIMKNDAISKFVIEGHTDNTNSNTYNLSLSQKRANQVKAYFIKSGIDSNRLKAIGYGEERPKYSNETQGSRQLNRRVEIKPISENDFNQLNEIEIEKPKQIAKTIKPSSSSDFSTSIHEVKKGENLYRISLANKISLERLLTDNNLKEDAVISVGQKIKIIKQLYHTVKKGDTLYSIALRYHISVNALKSINQLTNNSIFLGQKLKITKQ
ncbi:hypothetical protein GCM10011416_04120 [Polaribacter pacificus]|uniref:Outer membrane protein OmpA n=1 Tax=Polaribacter pacificus TaxID=1775173 RepID=A0A917HVH1_9FLAO|nr:OmpA family protein [Polaribacter pacificus]GGG90800.1 hypothetical protein GCM10011416_04120 [Polaribacter pacificus]